MKLQLTVSLDEAQRILDDIAKRAGTSNFDDGLASYWKTIVVDGDGTKRPTIMAFCWLYCWVVDKSLAHLRAARLAAVAWDDIVNISWSSIPSENRKELKKLAHTYRYKSEEFPNYIANIDRLLP